MQEKPEYFSMRGTIAMFKTDNAYYPACMGEGCNKKVVENGEGWYCEKCGRAYERPEYRYILAMAVADVTGQIWVQAFNEVAVELLGTSADDAAAAKVRATHVDHAS